MDNETKRIRVNILLIFGIALFVFSIYLSPNFRINPIQTVCAQKLQPDSTTFSASNQFTIPNLNGSISFASGGSFEYAILENDTWYFEGLTLNSYTLNLSARGAPPGGIVTGRGALPYLNENGAFNVSAKDSNITIIAYEPLASYYPYSGWLNYSVIGEGQQTFDLHFPTSNFAWNITIDGELKVENATWSFSNDNLIKVDGAKNMVSIYYNSLGVTRDRGVENPFPWQLIIIVVALTIVFVTSFILNQRHKAESKEVKHSQDFFKKLADP